MPPKVKEPAMPVVERGTSVAFNSAKQSWVLGTVDAYDPKTDTYTCSTKDPEPETCKVKNNHDDVFAPRAEYLEEDVNDLLTLTELHEASLLFCLKRRYMRDVVYTNIGPIVVALNPFTFDIPWYKDEKMGDYLTEGTVIERNLPHSWAVAHNTYWEMREDKRNQTILISGESGAGKTEGAKIVVKYVGVLSTMHGTKEDKDRCNVVNRKVIAASPILEAFGNAKTVRNDNSSRFGKFMKIQFDKDGFLVGTHATKYLLEKSRIITAGKDERVYHSFYQLAGGADNKKYSIKNAGAFKSAKSGECIAISGVDEAACFAEVKDAFTDVGITEDEQSGIWRICAGILFLQNVEFIEKNVASVTAAVVDPDWERQLDRACDLWGIRKPDMERELLRMTTMQRGELTVRNYDKAKAYDTRDSVSKGLYSWLFDWIVERINITTNNDAACFQWIGLLDIFGFEDFEINSFEQLCINLANETLQNHYNFFIFTEDVRECKEEGIDTTHVTFADNKPCIDLLAATKNSIFSMLDDECKMGSGTDAGFLNTVVTTFQTTKSNAGHPFFLACTGRQKDLGFRIRHYAGDVTYIIANFLEKNRDSLKDQMKEILLASSVPLIPPIVPPIEDTSRPTAKPTVSMFFTRQLKDLMDVINSTNPHWIRCIKPHPAKKARMFSHQSVITQLRSAGVLATVKIRQGGYPIRFTKDSFVRRYRALATKDDGDWRTDPGAVCKALFERLGIDPKVGQLGRTKVFLRQKAYMELNHAKDSASQLVAGVIQRIGKAMRSRQQLFQLYCKKNYERLMAERRAREEALRRQKEEEEIRRKAAEEARIRREEEERRRVLATVIVCQKYVRGKLTRLAFARHFVDVFRASDEAAMDSKYARCRTFAARTHAALRNLEQRDADRRRHVERDRLGLTTNALGVDGDGTDGAGGGRGARVNFHDQMLRRREQLRVKREAHMSRVDNRAHEREENTEKKIKQLRDRARAAQKEQQKVEEAAAAKARAERRKALQEKQAADEKRLATAAERRSTAVAKLEQRRRDVEEAQMRVMMEEAEQARAAKQRQLVDHSASHLRFTDSAAPVTVQSAFEDAKRDWTAQAAWEREREQRLGEAAALEKQWMLNYRRKLEWNESAASVSMGPRYPAACMSPVKDELTAQRRPRAESNGAPTALNARQVKLEAAFRKRQLENQRERAAHEELLAASSR